jgi:reactive intermediate/imine deaminase
MKKQIINTKDAPCVIGSYSQAVKLFDGATVYLSGQIPLIPKSMDLVSDCIADQIHQVFKNIRSICLASGGNLKDIVKLNIYLIDLDNFAEVNTIMAQYFNHPYPARRVIGVSILPKNSQIEADGIMHLVVDET